jgi:hypothetical protein
MTRQERLKALFDELERDAYNAEYHNYYYKEANQIIRKHFELSLPPAEGAETKKTCVLCTKPAMDNGLCYEHNTINVPKQPTAEGAGEVLEKHLADLRKADIKPPLRYGVIYNRIIDAMREFAAQQQPTAEGVEKRTDLRLQFERESESFWSVSAIPTIGYVRWLENKVLAMKGPIQPTAEGAEEIRREYSEESLDFFRSFIKARKELCAISPTETYSLEEGIRKAFDEFFPKPLSIVDDAEKILNSHPYLKVWIENPGDSEMKVCNIEQAIWAIEKAATLHAQKIADKMVSERLREVSGEPKFLFDICLSYRHDFGLLSAEEKERINFEAKEWMRSIINNLKSREK